MEIVRLAVSLKPPERENNMIYKNEYKKLNDEQVFKLKELEKRRRELQAEIDMMRETFKKVLVKGDEYFILKEESIF